MKNEEWWIKLLPGGGSSFSEWKRWTGETACGKGFFDEAGKGMVLG